MHFAIHVPQRQRSLWVLTQILLHLWNIESIPPCILAFLTLRCAETSGHELIFKTDKCELVSYLIGIGHEKQVVVGTMRLENQKELPSLFIIVSQIETERGSQVTFKLLFHPTVIGQKLELWEKMLNAGPTDILSETNDKPLKNKLGDLSAVNKS